MKTYNTAHWVVEMNNWITLYTKITECLWSGPSTDDPILWSMNSMGKQLSYLHSIINYC